MVKVKRKRAENIPTYGEEGAKIKVEEPTSAPDPYAMLEVALLEAYYRASKGKGAERHAENKPFDQQDIVSELRTFGPAPAIFQIRKKAKETLRMDRDAAAREALDVIVYGAALWIYYMQEV